MNLLMYTPCVPINIQTDHFDFISRKQLPTISSVMTANTKVVLLLQILRKLQSAYFLLDYTAILKSLCESSAVQ